MTNRQTLAAYEAGVDRYVDALAPRPTGPFVDYRERFAADLPAGAELLELGSGPGLDADWFSARGFDVRRTDATVAFVERLREDGHAADVLDVITDELGGPYDGIWASALGLGCAAAPESGGVGRRAGQAARGHESRWGFRVHRQGR